MSEILRHTKKNVLKLFRKLSLSNLKSSSTESGSEYKAKYQPQKNNSITISPSSNGMGRKRLNHKSKRDSLKHKNKSNRDDIEEDDDFTVPDRRRRSYIKTCIKKRLNNNNYEKQINCIQDENVVFTDNKIYISLSARNSSLGSNNSLKKNRRIIYPTSGPCKLSGFLRHYDFSYDDEHESPVKVKSAMQQCDEKLKFNMMKEHSSNSLNNVVFEKVKVKGPSSSSASSSGNYNEILSSSSYVHVTNNDDERNDDSILTSSTFITTSYEADDEDDVQWKNFLELRKQHGKAINNVSQLNDSGFGSQLFFTTNTKTWQQDDEIFDNSFNEELEQRVSIMFPELYKSSSSSSQSAHFNNINNINHITADKLS